MVHQRNCANGDYLECNFFIEITTVLISMTRMQKVEIRKYQTVATFTCPIFKHTPISSFFLSATSGISLFIFHRFSAVQCKAFTC